MRAVSQGRLKPAHQLVLASRARLEAPPPMPDALVNRMIQADVEVQERMLLEASPVAAVEHVGGRQIECSSNQPTFPARLHQLHPVAELLQHALEERRRE